MRPLTLPEPAKPLLAKRGYWVVRALGQPPSVSPPALTPILFYFISLLRFYESPPPTLL